MHPAECIMRRLLKPRAAVMQVQLSMCTRFVFECCPSFFDDLRVYRFFRFYSEIGRVLGLQIEFLEDFFESI